jgi:hypothetical protein
MQRRLGPTFVLLVMAAAALGACSDPDASTAPGAGGTGGSPPPPTGTGGGGPAPDPSPTPPAVASLPPPISGGTLLVLRDGHTVIAADPDRDRIYVADLMAQTVRATVVLAPRSEPGRAVEDGGGRVHVALRRGGAVVTVDPSDGKVLARRALCPAPRGLAYDGKQDLLHVACAGGELLSIRPLEVAAARAVRLDRDLRDVVVRGDKLLISTFRSAELLLVGADGLEQRLRPGATRAASRPISLSQEGGTGMASPAVAWRMVPAPGGQTLLIHQRGADDPVGTEPSAYGGAGSCAGVVESAVSKVDESGGEIAIQSGGALTDAVVPVDMAVSPDGQQVAVVAAGNAGTEQQVMFFDMAMATAPPPPKHPCVPGAAPRPPGGGEVPPSEDGGAPPDAGASPDAGDPGDAAVAFALASDRLPRPIAYRPPAGEVIAVAFDPAGNVVVQSREPAMLQVLTQRLAPIVLSYESRGDQGHRLFHDATPGKLACASCHPEGGEDGRVWRFVGHGSRRTQSLRGGIMDTAPFHWSGDQPTLDHLMADVFQGRMGGGPVDRSRVRALGRWLDQVPTIAPSLPRDPAMVERGRALFARGDLACGTCHRGSDFTQTTSFDVGTGAPFQVPQLHDLAFRAPFLHDGCAATLVERFTRCGGGDRHGVTSKLTGPEIDDLVAYLESL